jgi:hypothetical protein
MFYWGTSDLNQKLKKPLQEEKSKLTAQSGLS